MDTSYEGEKAVLSSPELYSEEWSCVRLIYQIAASPETSPDPTRLNLYVRQEGESFDRLLWSAKEPSDSWLIASLDLANSTKKYKVSLILEGTAGSFWCSCWCVWTAFQQVLSGPCPWLPPLGLTLEPVSRAG